MYSSTYEVHVKHASEVHVQQYTLTSGLCKVAPLKFMYSIAVQLGIRYMYSSACEVNVQQDTLTSGLCTAAPVRFLYSSTYEVYLKQGL
jgi:hypothetical protein